MRRGDVERPALSVGLAVIDTKMLQNVGPVPVGGIYLASQLRNTLIGNARYALAGVIQSFERSTEQAGDRFNVQVAKDDPISDPARLTVG